MAKISVVLEKEDVKEAKEVLEAIKEFREKDKIRFKAFLEGIKFAGEGR